MRHAQLTTRNAFSLLVAFLIAGCGAGEQLGNAEHLMDRLSHAGHDHPMDHFATVWRFTEIKGEEPQLEYLGGPKLEEARLEGVIPASDGPMRVDCSRYADFGLLVRRTFVYHRANPHRVRFRLLGSSGEEVELKTYVRQRRSGRTPVMSYYRKKQAMPHYYIKGLARFIGEHRDGLYRFQLLHLDEVLDEVEFELYNCENRPVK